MIELAYFDHAATTPVPTELVDLQVRLAHLPRANAWRGLYSWAEDQTAALETVRAQILQSSGLVGYKVVFTRGTTNALNALAQSWSRSSFKQTGKVAVSALEHQANYLPWAAAGEVVVWPTSERVDVIALSAASNVTGETQDIRAAVASGARVVVDAAQFVPHQALPGDGWGAEVIVVSGHKMYGPMSLGLMFIKETAWADWPAVILGGGMTEQQGWEAGTWPVKDAQWLAAAWQWLAKQDQTAVWQGYEQVKAWLLANDVRLLPTTGQIVAPIISWVPKSHPHDLAAALAEKNVAVRAGLLCAGRALEFYQVPTTGVVRLSFGLTNTPADVDRLLAVLAELKPLL